MIDPFLLLTPILILVVMALLRFIGCDIVFGVNPIVLLYSDPPPDSYFQAQTVTLTCDDSGADLQYTTDSSYQHYSGPIQVSATTTIKAFGTVTEYGFYHFNTAVFAFQYFIGPITFQQLAELDDATNASPDPTAVTTNAFAGNIGQGTLMVVWIYYSGPDDGSITVSSVTDPAGNSYTRAVGPTPQGPADPALAGYRQEIWYAVITSTNTGGAPFSVTAQFTGAITVDKAISAHAYVGANTGDPVDKAADMTTPIVAGSSGLSGAVSAGPVTTTNARLVFAAAVFINAPAGGPGGGFRQQSMLAGNVSEDADVPNLGQVVQATFTATTNPWIAQMCAFK